MLHGARSLQFVPSDLVRSSLSSCVPQKVDLWVPCSAVSNLVFTCQEVSRVREGGLLWVACFSTQGCSFHQAALSTQLSLLVIPLSSCPFRHRPSESSQLFLASGTALLLVGFPLLLSLEICSLLLTIHTDIVVNFIVIPWFPVLSLVPPLLLHPPFK